VRGERHVLPARHLSGAEARRFNTLSEAEKVALIGEAPRSDRPTGFHVRERMGPHSARFDLFEGEAEGGLHLGEFDSEGEAIAFAQTR
jgi:hypothetical protein